MANDIRGITIVFEGDTVSIDKSVNSLNNALKGLKSEFKTLNKELKLDPTDINKINKALTNLESQQKVVTERLTIYKQELKELQDAGDIGSEEWTKLYKEVQKNEQLLNNINKQINNLNNANLNRINDQFKSFGQSMQSASDSIEKAGKALVPLSTAATAALGGAAYSAIEFESAFAGVEKTVDATVEQLDEMSEGIRQLALEIPATTTEISAVAQAAGQLGIAADDILEFSEVMIGLGEATNLTSDEAATMIAQFANVTQMEGSYERFASALVDLGNNCATTEKDILELAQRLAGAATTAGISQQDILALSATMASLGINAEAGGSAMSKFISTLESEVAKGGDELAKFAEVAGMSADEFADTWEKAPTDAIAKFIDGLGEIDDAGGSAILVLEDLGLSEIRLRDTLLRLSNAQGELNKNIEISNSAWEENLALSNETSKRYATTESQLAILKNTLNEVGIALGTILLPYVNKALSVIKGVLNAFASLNPAMQQVILLLTTLTATLAPLLLGLSKVFGAIGAVSQAIGTYGLGSSLVAVVAPLGAVIALFGTLFMASEEFRLGLENFLIPVITELYNFISEYIIPILQTLWDWFVAYIVPAVLEVARVIGDNLGAALTGIGQLFVGIIDLLSIVFDWLVALWDWLDDLGVWSAFGSILEFVGGVINSVVSSLSSLFGWLGKVTGAIGSFLSSFSDLLGRVGSGIGDIVGGFFSGGYGDIQSGGFGAVNLTTNITVNTSREITEQDTRKWALSMVDVINEELGALV